MSDLSIDALTRKILSVGIMSQSDIQELWLKIGTTNIESEFFLQEAVRQGYLTNYQVDRLNSDDPGGFFFGKYKALYMVGAGTFARVFRAAHKDTEKIVAVKVLRGRFSENPEVINHFMHEAELGIDLRHPNIVPIFEASSEGFLHFMVMDFIEGQTLREFIKIRKKIEPKITTRIITDICDALDYAYRRGVQHRDMKASNVLLSSMGKAMLADFGLAAITEKLAAHAPDVRNQRSIDYAVLERMTGVPRDDRRSDLYFLGCIYYHMLTGVPPLFETKDRNKRMDKNRFYNVKPIHTIDPTIPKAVSFVVNKAMTLDPEKRYQSAAEMLNDLKDCGERLSRGTANDGSIPNYVEAELAKKTPTPSVKEKQFAVMVVDSDPNVQNVFREYLKKANYRVLVVSSPERAIDRFKDDGRAADIVIFNAQSLGMRAVEGFNRLTEDFETRNLPAILLLNEDQSDLVMDARRSKHRIALAMPITMRKLRESIARLLNQETQIAVAKAVEPIVPASNAMEFEVKPDDEAETDTEGDTNFAHESNF